MIADKVDARLRRKRRVRKKVRGLHERPRLCVYKSNQHIYAQVIDDGAGTTLAAASTLSPEVKGVLRGMGNVAAAKKVGELIAERCRSLGIEKVVFDRNGFLYHGRVKALADEAREKGIKF